MINSFIPFNRPALAGRELENLQAVFQNGKLSSNGDYTAKCERWLEEALGCSRALLTHSCTAALELAARLLRLGPGDEVIVPSFTFSSTANAVVLTGATPIFADVDISTMNIDPSKIGELITPKTKAIFVTHYAGLPPDMDTINEIALRNDLKVVEDAAQSLGSFYNEQPAGTHSSMSTFSFHETKNIISGEGGALVINDKDYIARSEVLCEMGTNRQAFFQGQVDKYTWTDLGSSYHPAEYVAAFLHAQLNEAEAINHRRLAICATYYDTLAEFSEDGLSLPVLSTEKGLSNGHIFWALLPTTNDRNSFLKQMRDRNVQATFHYLPLHSSPAGKKFGRAPDGCPVTEDASARLFRLPVFYGMTDTEVSQVSMAARSVLENILRHPST